VLQPGIYSVQVFSPAAITGCVPGVILSVNGNGVAIFPAPTLPPPVFNDFVCGTGTNPHVGGSLAINWVLQVSAPNSIIQLVANAETGNVVYNDGVTLILTQLQ
jgi:hypothetical protein